MTQLSRRLVVAGLLLTPTFAYAQALSAADQAVVDKAVAYLQGLTTARGRFTQTDPRGRRASGDFYLNRPGKIRFDYDSPNEVLIVSDGNQVLMQDARLGTDERVPLRSTPLAMFLAREIRLSGARITKVERGDGQFAITAANGEGQIILNFQDNPVKLKEWTAIDRQRQRTRVVLDTLSPVGSLDPNLFKFKARPTAGRPGR